MLKQIASTSTGDGNAPYIDPLSFKDPSYKRGKKSDIFSLGVVLWEISSKQAPCEGVNQTYQVILYRLNGSRDPPFPGTPQEYIKLYSACWDEDPSKRPLCENIYKQLQSLLNQLLGEKLDLGGHNIGDAETISLAKALESESLIVLYQILNEFRYKKTTTLIKALESYCL